MAKRVGETRRSTPKGAGASDNGQRPSEDYRRFESLTKRLVRVPKREIDEQAAKHAARKRS